MPTGGGRAEGLMSGFSNASKKRGKFDSDKGGDEDTRSMARMAKIKRELYRNSPRRQNTSEELRSAVLRKLMGRS